MEILFLGTGAADRMALEQEKTFEDKDKRRCASVLINGCVLLDCGPHTLNALSVAKINLSDISDIVITHLHKDHFDLEAVESVARAAGKVNLWYRSDATMPNIVGCALNPMVLFTEYDVCGLKITGVPANHEAFPQHLSISDNSKNLFYGLDGAWFLGDTVRFMQNKLYDAVVLDATVGDYTGDYRIGEHNSIPMIRLLIPSFKTLNIIDDRSKIILSHMAVCLHKSYDETCRTTQNDKFIIAYDGMRINV